MKKILLAGLATGLLLVGTIGVASATSVNLIQNGSFENNDVTAHNGRWQQFESIEVDNWWKRPGNLIEIQDASLFGPAAEGNQYIELDARVGDNTWLTQRFNTVVGQEYEFTFAFSPRPGVLDNTLQIGAGAVDKTAPWLDYLNITLAPISGVGNDTTAWTYYSYSFTALTDLSFIGFKDAGRDNSLGTIIDDVSVNAVPEPTTMLLFGVGLMGLTGLARRKK